MRSRRGALALALAAAIAATLASISSPVQASPGGIAATAPSAPAATAADVGIDFGAIRLAGATWYGPGLYGNRTACGQVLRPGTLGVAHRNLPCGAAVKFLHDGRTLVTRVIDRGPYTAGNAWDLTNGARLALGFEGVGRIRYAVERRYAPDDEVAMRDRSARSRG